MKRTTIELIREANYVTEVLVERIEDETGWSPFLKKHENLTPCVSRFVAAMCRPQQNTDACSS